MRPEAEFAEDRMVCLDGFHGTDHAIDDQTEELDEDELILCGVDLAPKRATFAPYF